MARIGEILTSKGAVTKAQLEEALTTGKKTKTRVGRVLVKLGYTDEETVAGALAEQQGIPCVDLNEVLIDSKLVKLLPEAIAKRYGVIPVALKDGVLHVAMVDPLDVFAIDEIKRVTRKKIRQATAAETGILKAIDQHYGLGGTIDEMARKIEASEVELVGGEAEYPEKLERVAGEASIVQLVSTLISQAVREGASDLHVEPDEDTLRIRMRIDGLLHETSNLSLKLHPAVISRIKVLGDLNIAEKRLPQDGRFFVKVGERDIDVRLSTMPTIFGEKAVLRLLDKEGMILDFERLTPFPDTLDPLKKAIKRPFGMVLLTGPTGSGKTTTAYTLINLINSMDKNIVTVEDPVEYNLKVVNQIQVNPRVGITFANALRHILRQDPDIVMIGEVRDKETAEIAIRAALTGHLLISTVHTNDAAGTITRLVEMGIEPFLVGSAVICIVGQRLVRKICQRCKESYEPDTSVLEELGVAPAPGGKAPVFYRGKGCPSCKGVGLKGRMAIYEVFTIDEKIRTMITRKEEAPEIIKAAKEKGFKTLRDQGVRAVLEGHTSVEEILLATQVPE